MDLILTLITCAALILVALVLPLPRSHLLWSTHDVPDGLDDIRARFEALDARCRRIVESAQSGSACSDIAAGYQRQIRSHLDLVRWHPDAVCTSSLAGEIDYLDAALDDLDAWLIDEQFDEIVRNESS